MDVNQNKSNKTKKRKRNDSTSSNTSSNYSGKRPFEGIPTFEYSSDNSLTSDSPEQNFESTNTSWKTTSVINKIPPGSAESDTTDVRLLKLLKKARAAIENNGKDHPHNSNDFLKALNKLKSDKSGSQHSLSSSTASTLKALSSSSRFGNLIIQLLDDEDDSSSNDDENGPSTSTGHGKKSGSKVSKGNISSQSPTSKSIRKRRVSASSNSLNNQDPDLDFEPSSAKRQQRLPSIYQSQPDSVASSVYSSPLDELLVTEIDTESNNSNVHSPDTEYNDDNRKTESNTTILDSPNSLQNSDDTDDDSLLETECSHHSCEEDNCAKINHEDEIISHIHSPYPARFRRSTQHNGEQTPAQFPLEDEDNNNSNSNSKKIEKSNVLPFEEYANSVYSCMTPAAENDPPRQCPLPALSWANANEVWQTMCKKDEQATGQRDSSMLERHPGLHPRMRAILLDWLIEVCEVYKLHRETYYLAVDYLDRYLTTKFRVQKTHLQLIGITCLFVAAKVEEIYPPKIGEFAYVTDGACQETDILHNEILLLQALDWDINPVTPMAWLGVYMQLNVNNRTPKTFSNRTLGSSKKSENGNKTNEKTNSNSIIDDAFIYPQFSGFEFVQTAQLLDLCSLDVGVAHFPYSVLATAAMSHTFNKETALRCSGLDWQTIQPCARWMEPFFTVISSESEHLYIPEQNEQVASKFGVGHICYNISTDDSHIIQTHSITMAMFDRVTQIQEQLITMAKTIKTEASPAIGLIFPDGLLTPPASSRKPLDVLDEDLSKTSTKTKTIATTKVQTTSQDKNGQNNKNKSAAIIIADIAEKKRTATVDKDSKRT